MHYLLYKNALQITKEELHLPEHYRVGTLSDYPPKFQINVKRIGGITTADSITPELIVHGLDKEYSFEIIVESKDVIVGV